MSQPANPALYEIHTRAWLHERSLELGGPAVLDDVTDEALDRIAALGFDWVWLLGAWQTGPASRAISLAPGRDPYFPGWTDTLQLNYRHGGFREAMIGQLLRIAELCDGVRCDMAMLVLPEIFLRTWGDLSDPRDGTRPDDAPFWVEAI